MPNATFLAFTGTPMSKDDRDTQSVFGQYVSIYDIQQAVEDGATVPVTMITFGKDQFRSSKFANNRRGRRRTLR